MQNAQTLLESDRDAAQVVETWADLSNALFDPESGLIAKAYPTRAEREQFVQTDEYRAIRKLIDEARQRTGLVAGATPSKSGKLLVRLPKSLHAALDIEAAAEGVSLNQLVVAKLAFQLSSVARGSKPSGLLSKK